MYSVETCNLHMVWSDSQTELPNKQFTLSVRTKCSQRGRSSNYLRAQEQQQDHSSGSVQSSVAVANFLPSAPLQYSSDVWPPSECLVFAVVKWSVSHPFGDSPWSQCQMLDESLRHPPKFGKKCFSGKNHVKFGDFVNFLGIYRKFGNFVNFSGKYHVKFRHFVNFSCIYFPAKMSSPPKLTELLRLWIYL